MFPNIGPTTLAERPAAPGLVLSAKTKGPGKLAWATELIPPGTGNNHRLQKRHASHRQTAQETFMRTGAQRSRLPRRIAGTLQKVLKLRLKLPQKTSKSASNSLKTRRFP